MPGPIFAGQNGGMPLQGQPQQAPQMPGMQMPQGAAQMLGMPQGLNLIDPRLQQQNPMRQQLLQALQGGLLNQAQPGQAPASTAPNPGSAPAYNYQRMQILPDFNPDSLPMGGRGQRIDAGGDSFSLAKLAQNQQQAKNVYQMLGLTPDDQGVNYWADKLNAGYSNDWLQQAMKGASANDLKNKESILAQYQALGITPDQPGVDYWMQQMRAVPGRTVDWLKSAMAGAAPKAG